MNICNTCRRDTHRCCPCGNWRLLLGNTLGVLAIPLSVIGYCQTLKLSGIKRTTWMFWLIAYGAALGAVGHAGITACIVLLKQSDALMQAFNYLESYVAVPFGVFLICYLMPSVWYCIVVLSKSTLYPKWMAMFNPFLLSMVIVLLSMSKVFPVLTTMLSPAWLSPPQLVFFTCSTLMLWNLTEERVKETVYAKSNQ